jgi:NAD+ diphosphatase
VSDLIDGTTWDPETGPDRAALDNAMLDREPLNRAAHRRTDPAWLADAWTRAKIVVVDAPDKVTGRVLVSGPVPPLAISTAGQPEGKTELVLFDAAHPVIEASRPELRFFLGVDDADTPYFVVVGELPETPGATAATLREVGHLLDGRSAGILATALALVNWHARHPFSPANGEPTMIAEGGWTRVDADGAQHWPRTDPAVIMLVHDGVAGNHGRCLLANNSAWPPRAGRIRRYSCLAGFVEPGESAEDAVAREVFEEVGVHVRDVRYVASQPWPYPGSLMLGFYALADPDEQMHLDPTEIAAARWFARAEIVAAIDAMSTPDGASAGFGLPMGASIAFRLVRGWATAAS